MKVFGILDFSQVNAAIKDGSISIFGIEFVLRKDMKTFLSSPAVKIQHNGVVNKNTVMLAIMDPSLGNIIEAFSPNGPPDPGIPEFIAV